jgi:hypothetical protein
MTLHIPHLSAAHRDLAWRADPGRPAFPQLRRRGLSDPGRHSRAWADPPSHLTTTVTTRQRSGSVGATADRHPFGVVPDLSQFGSVRPRI